MKKIVYILFILPFLIQAQHTISGTLSPAEEFTYVFLYKATPTGANYIDRGKLDDAGNFSITLNESVTPGIYKIVYAVPPEENNFDIIYDGKESISFNFNKDTGVEFTASIENKLWNSYLNSIAMVNQTISNYYAKDGENKNDFDAVFKTLKDTQQSYEDAAKDKLVSTFITANRPYIPSEYEDVSEYSKKLKTNYLSNIDLNNYLLQSSSFIVDRVTNYVFNLVAAPSTETYKQLVDEAADALKKADRDLRLTLMNILWKRFVAVENHEMANYVTDNHLLALAKAAKDEILQNTIVGYRNTSVGRKAPDFEILSQTDLAKSETSLHQLKGAKNYLLVFWSSSCGHCLNELPVVKKLVSTKKDLQVVAYGLESDKASWSNEIKNYPDFIHTIGLGKWENQIVKTYGINATPSYLLLSEDKIIMAKPYSFEDLKILINSL